MSRVVPCRVRALILVAGQVVAAACGGSAHLPVEAGMGAHPELPAPRKSLIPTVKVAKAVGWPAGATPKPATDLVVGAFATGLDHPRWLAILPNGDVLVAETNAPPRPDNTPKGIKGWFFKRFQKKAGGAVPSANRITLLRDTDGDGVADVRSVFLDSLTSPFGMTLVGDQLYVANTEALVRFPYVTGATQLDAPAVVVATLPGGTLNHHWTKNVIASADGSTLYVAVGSNSNAAENGLAKQEERAAIWAIDARTGAHRIFGSGLRNPVGLAWEPERGALWVAVNERDALGSDLVPDYMTAVQEGGFYGWPFSYYGEHIDDRVKPQRPDLVARAIVPDYALGPHTASLGLAWSGGATLGPAYRAGMFVGQHGSWNRKPVSGYKVIFVPFAEGQPSGAPIDILDRLSLGREGDGAAGGRRRRLVC